MVGGMTAPDSSLEIERKYAVDAGFVLPDLAAVPGVAAVTSPRTYHLTAVYHDTPGQRLAAARITLRRRIGGTDSGWHLKLPAGDRRRAGGAGRPGVGADRRRAAAPHRPAPDHPHGAAPAGFRRAGAG